MILPSFSSQGTSGPLLSRGEKCTVKHCPVSTALGLFHPAVAMQQCEMLAQHDLDLAQ